ncbi:hypothetical protein [Sulfitobacter guttiformis]|uniref:hypothetical protein n=1 Tax=Sulfitobacter guttiformis TaxID=74349 RepID=UPI00046AD0FF|nr:hypothetical protein [Sulfitobacter guttiformis]KIN72355.1 hypothetical protein Z949_1528 [Sulfitobacter guttiformis KCTC 32187]
MAGKDRGDLDQNKHRHKVRVNARKPPKTKNKDLSSPMVLKLLRSAEIAQVLPDLDCWHVEH